MTSPVVSDTASDEVQKHPITSESYKIENDPTVLELLHSNSAPSPKMREFLLNYSLILEKSQAKNNAQIKALDTEYVTLAKETADMWHAKAEELKWEDPEGAREAREWAEHYENLGRIRASQREGSESDGAESVEKEIALLEAQVEAIDMS